MFGARIPVKTVSVGLANKLRVHRGGEKEELRPTMAAPPPGYMHFPNQKVSGPRSSKGRLSFLGIPIRSKTNELKQPQPQWESEQ